MYATQCFKMLQRRATIYILESHDHDYKTRLVSLTSFPLTLWLEIQDILLLIKLLKFPRDIFQSMITLVLS